MVSQIYILNIMLFKQKYNNFFFNLRGCHFFFATGVIFFATGDIFFATGVIFLHTVSFFLHTSVSLFAQPIQSMSFKLIFSLLELELKSIFFFLSGILRVIFKMKWLIPKALKIIVFKGETDYLSGSLYVIKHWNTFRKIKY